MLFVDCGDDLQMLLWCCMFFFFFKQKTAYEMRISDWSSDVCSSDLRSKPTSCRIAAGPSGVSRTTLRLRTLRRVIGPSSPQPPEARIEQVAQAVAQEVQPEYRCHDGEPRKDGELRGEIHESRSEEHTSELQSLMRNSYAVF